MRNRKAALVCCSNALHPKRKAQVDALGEMLKELGVDTAPGMYLFGENSWDHGSPQKRARELMDCYLDDSITEIYDISGGDLANTLLPYLDFDAIRANHKPFWGYSDLTVILNAIYAQTGREGVLYQVRNLIADSSGIQRERFLTNELFCMCPRFLRGSYMEGILVGGNIRCFLKLAGTPYFPDLTEKILLLEAYGGEVPQMMKIGRASCRERVSNPV